MGLDKLDRDTARPSHSGHWGLPVGTLLIGVLLLMAGETGREWFRFDRPGIGSGQFWRLLTGHFVHLGWPHFTLNAAGLALVWYLVGGIFRSAQWLLVAAFCILTMDLGLWFYDRDLVWYVGLSGLLHGILAAGLVARLGKPDVEGLLLAGLLLGKLAWEQFSGPLPGSETTAGGAVVVDAHLFGALGGSLAAIVVKIRVRLGASI